MPTLSRRPVAAAGLAALSLLGALGIVAAPPAGAAVTDIEINEVESNGGTPGDWVELINTGATAQDIGGLQLLDGDVTHAKYVIPAGTVVPAGGRFVLEEAQFGWGLGGAETVTLFATDGTTVLDTHSWSVHAAVTYSACPEGSDTFVPSASTKGTANDCSSTTTTAPTTTIPAGNLAWPGSSSVSTVDLAATWTSNLSGLVYEGSGSSSTGTLWAVQNGPGTLFRLAFDGANWVPTATDGWTAGKALKYLDGGGNVDAEGVTFGGTTPAGGVFVAAERNNDASSTSRNSILRFDPAAGGAATTLTATNEWNLTADLAPNGANLGLEAITWIPDADLVAKGFRDQTAGKPYTPADYPNHGTGLFFVGVEAGGAIHAYALDLTGSSFTRIATIASGFTGVMGLEYDRDLQDLWAVCDDTCSGRSKILRVDPSSGAYVPVLTFERPAGMGNFNNEGFAIASATECAAGQKPVFWANDNDTDTFSLRRGTLPCARLASEVTEVPNGAGPLPLVALAGLLGVGALALGRRRPA